MTNTARARSATRWLRRSYRIGALVEGLAAIGMAFPGPLWAQGFRAPFDRNRAELAYGMRVGAPLMAGWALLLLWADRDAMQRKSVLPLSCAVVLGLLANDTAAVRSGYVDDRGVLRNRVVQGALLGLFAASYLGAVAAERSR
jgi:hypothetical protein